ncbi:MAG: hypothetical protein RI928_2627 [Pseudomonadota bacterium]|jgi:hypothetical protein
MKNKILRYWSSSVITSMIVFTTSLCMAQQTPKVALVIGNATYKNSPLRNPENDAKDFAKSLKGFGFTVIERTNLTTKQIGPMLREFRSKLVPGSVAVVFYAGHGLQIKGENYLPTVDADIQGEEDVPMQSLSTRQLMDVLAESGTRMNLVFLDACRNNPYSRRFRSTTRGLSRENAPSGTLISFATRPGSEAADGDGRNGLYTSVLLQQIKLADQPIEQVLKKVVAGVKQASNGQQEPWIEGSIDGDFCFAECGSSSNARLDADDEAWAITQKSNNVSAYQAYLAKFPTGRYKAAAEIALSALKGGGNSANEGRESRNSDTQANNRPILGVWYSDDCDGKINNSFKVAVKWHTAQGKLYMREHNLGYQSLHELNVTQSIRGRETLFNSTHGTLIENVYEFDGESAKLIQRTFDGKVAVQGGMWIHDKYVMPRLHRCAPNSFMVKQAEQISLNSCNDLSDSNSSICLGSLPAGAPAPTYVGEIWRGKKHGWGVELQKNQVTVARYTEGQITGDPTVFKPNQILGSIKSLPLELQIDFSKPKCLGFDANKFMVRTESPCYIAEPIDGGFVLGDAAGAHPHGSILIYHANNSTFTQVKNGIPNGYARMPAPPWFAGEVKSGLKNGFGMLQLSKSGAIYIGEFKDDKYNGKGRILGNMLYSPSEDLGDGLTAGTGEAVFIDGHIKR